MSIVFQCDQYSFILGLSMSLLKHDLILKSDNLSSGLLSVYFVAPFGGN